MLVPDGRRLVWGWVNGFRGGHGWNGCLTLPASWACHAMASCVKAPRRNWQAAGKPAKWRNLVLKAGANPLVLPKTNALEISADIDLQSAEGLSLILKNGAENAKPFTVALRRSSSKMAEGNRADLSIALDHAEQKLNVRVFIDRCVLEVFVNDNHCATKVIPLVDANATLVLRPNGGGEALAKRIQCWPLTSIW